MSEAGVLQRRRSRSEVEALVSEFEMSGLMRAAFCQQRGIAVGTLDKYRRRVQSKPQPDLYFLLKWFLRRCGMDAVTSSAMVFLLFGCEAGVG